MCSLMRLGLSLSCGGSGVWAGVGSAGAQGAGDEAARGAVDTDFHEECERLSWHGAVRRQSVPDESALVCFARRSTK